MCMTFKTVVMPMYILLLFYIMVFFHVYVEVWACVGKKQAASTPIKAIFLTNLFNQDISEHFSFKRTRTRKRWN